MINVPTPVVEEYPDHMPGRCTVAEDGFVKIKQKPYKKPIVLDRDAAPPPRRADILFAEDELAGLPLIIRRTTVGARAHVWVDKNGKWWRSCGFARIQRSKETGKRTFLIVLKVGANKVDLTFLLKVVEEARAGNLKNHGWERITADWADENTLHWGYSRPYKDPFTHSDPSPIVFPCTEPECVKKWHTADDSHEHDEIHQELKTCGSYTIRVRKEQFPGKGDPKGWYVEVFCDEFYGSPEHVASLITDLEWAREECRRANAETPAAGEDVA